MARTVTAQEFMAVGASPSRARNLADQINTIDPSIRERYADTAKGFYSAYGSQGYELSINQAARTNAQQQAIKASGVKAASPSNTWHTVAAAVDFSIHKKGTLDKGTTLKNAYDTLLAPIAAKFGLSNPIKNDVGHFMPSEFPAARRGRSVADFIDAIPETQFANVPIPAEKPTQVAAAPEAQQGVLSSLFSQPTAAARDFSGVTSDELALALAPNANIAPAGIFDSLLAPAPAPEVQRAMLDSLPGALPAAPVSPVSVASLDPVTQYSSLPAAPVQEVTSAPLRDVPANAYSAPVTAVERAALADLPSNLAAAPVGAVEKGGMLRPASEPSFRGNPNLTEANPDAFEGYWTYNGTPVTAIAPTASPDSWDISTAPGADFMMSRTGGPVGPVSAEPFGNVNAPYSGDYALADSLSFSDYANPMGAPLGSVQTPVTPDQNFGAVAPSIDQETIAASISPVAEPYSMFGVGPADPNMTLNAQTPTYGGINAMTALSNASMANLPAIDPNVPLDLTSIPVPATKPLAPLAPPVEVPQYKVASPAPMQQAPVQAMSVPSGMDVWSGMSNYGVATDGSTLSRNPNGTVTRTSAKYGNVETYNPATDRWSPGAPKTNAMGTVGNTLTNPTGISMPSKERVGSFAKGIAGGAAGAAVGGALGLGPIGAMLGAALGRSLAQGQGVSGMFGQSTSMFPGAPGPGTGLTQTDQARIAKTFGYSGATPGAGDPMSRGYSPAAHDSIGRGETVGLF